MIRFEVTAEDLLHSRFAISPLSELHALLRHLAGGTQQRLEWTSRLQPTFVRLRHETDLEVLLALLSPRYGPEFVAPPPRSLAQAIDDDIAAVRATALTVARAEIAEAMRRQPIHDPDILKILGRDDITDHLADILERAWYELVAPNWPHLRAISERDVIHRSSELSRAGWTAALAGLHSKVRWNNNGIEISKMTRPRPIVLGGAGMLFVPSVFKWPKIAVYTEEPWPKAIIYPARGTGSLWESPTVAPQELSDLIGRTRARLLLVLDEPASTTQLAHLTNVAVGTVNDHLHVLHRAGLLTSARVGRSILYRRTPRGDIVAGVGEALCDPQR
jgi:DNA-binding transcriptional ArsR family regulator